MKRVIREGVFETNSSSTHSVSIRRRSVDSEDFPSGRIETPYDKMMFYWGFVCEDYACEKKLSADYIAYYDLSEEELLTEHEEMTKAEKRHLLFRDILLEECAKLEYFNSHKAIAAMDLAEEYPDEHVLCRDFFFDGPIAECWCGMDTLTIHSFLGFWRIETEAQMREFAKKLFDDDVFFVTEER